MTLRIEIDCQRIGPQQRKSRAQIERSRGLADAAFLIEYRDYRHLNFATAARCVPSAGYARRPPHGRSKNTIKPSLFRLYTAHLRKCTTVRHEPPIANRWHGSAARPAFVGKLLTPADAQSVRPLLEIVHLSERFLVGILHPVAFHIDCQRRICDE
jgi:hypothetical protein